MPALLNRARQIQEVPRTDQRIKRLSAALVAHQRRPDALIEVLHIAQDTFGYLPLSVIAFIARELKVPPSKVYAVATFYHFFSLKPKGEHNCLICTGTACYVKGADALIAAVQREFALRPGESTPDNKLGLQTARCLGACGLAPAAVVDNEILAQVSPADIAQILRQKIGGAP